MEISVLGQNVKKYSVGTGVAIAAQGLDGFLTDGHILIVDLLYKGIETAIGLETTQGKPGERANGEPRRMQTPKEQQV